MSRKLDVTLWRTFSRGRRDEHTWRSFIDTFVSDPQLAYYKRKVAGFSLASFRENRRAASRVERVHAITFDFDGGDTTVEQASKLFHGIQSVAYTTFSHTPDWPKTRLILLLPKPVSSEDYARIWDWASNKIATAGHVIDMSARDASRFWYLPSHAPGAPYEWRETEGKPLETSKILKEVASTPWLFPGVEAETKRSAFRARALENSQGGGDTFWCRVFEEAGLALGEISDKAFAVTCPWVNSHRSPTTDFDTVIFTDTEWGLFHCSHAHCAERKTLDLLGVMPVKALEKARRDHGAGFLRAKIRSGFMQHLPAFNGSPALDRLVLRCWPQEASSPTIWTVKIGSRPHVEGLESLPVKALVGRHVDLALRGRDITWGRLVAR